MIRKEDCKLLPNMTGHKCFGCGPGNHSGLKMVFYTNGSSILSWVTVPDHLCGWENLVHGGVLSTMLDEIMARAMIHSLKSLGLTKSMTVNFIKPVHVGKEVMVEGKILEGKEDREAITEGVIYDDKGDVCTRSTGTFMLFSPQAIKRKGISSDDVIEWFEKYVEVK
ncbi:MAG: PaaI family thioesterase [Syntrophales bacterium]|jgi:uncharacterized protein (TIGR00369 family)